MLWFYLQPLKTFYAAGFKSHTEDSAFGKVRTQWLHVLSWISLVPLIKLGDGGRGQRVGT